MCFVLHVTLPCGFVSFCIDLQSINSRDSLGNGAAVCTNWNIMYPMAFGQLLTHVEMGSMRAVHYGAL